MTKIIQDRENCIGCGSCAAVCQAFWDMDYENGKAVLKGGKKNEKGEYEIETEDTRCNKEAAEVCPVQVIKII